MITVNGLKIYIWHCRPTIMFHSLVIGSFAGRAVLYHTIQYIICPVHEEKSLAKPIRVHCTEVHGLSYFLHTNDITTFSLPLPLTGSALKVSSK